MAMTYQADFADAHHRHWEDAELLFGNERWANADQLYGFSVECGLKAVMRTLGMSVDTEGTPDEKKYRKHVRELWPIFQDFADGRGGVRYLRLLPGGEPFDDWSHHQRYVHRCDVHEAKVKPHREAAGEICQMVGVLAQDGN